MNLLPLLIFFLRRLNNDRNLCRFPYREKGENRRGKKRRKRKTRTREKSKKSGVGNWSLQVLSIYRLYLDLEWQMCPCWFKQLPKNYMNTWLDIRAISSFYCWSRQKRVTGQSFRELKVMCWVNLRPIKLVARSPSIKSTLPDFYFFLFLHYPMKFWELRIPWDAILYLYSKILGILSFDA